VTGLISDGLRFIDAVYLDQLLQKGLDHMMIVLDTGKAGIWDALKNVIAADIFLAIHLTITSEIVDQFPSLLDRLAALGVKAISLSLDNPDAKERLQKARDLVASRGIELVWNLPVPYSSLHPVAMETSQSEKLPGVGRDWMYLEPDGDVLPAQGINQVLGNMLHDPWEKIWKR
jgi:MoaA/NifB/PqqE/SkfB family radical SAM enzyme